MDNKDHLKHKKEEILYEMNAVRHYIEDQEFDEQLKGEWDKDVRQLKKIDHLLEKIEMKENKAH